MVPILIGAQGQQKSTLVEVIAPTMDEYTSIALSERDDNLSRVLRGKVVAEWGELRGLETRDSEAIKDWVSRRKDDWIPKFKEFGTTLPRRFILIGTTNNHHVLNDPTGSRRYLPVFIPGTINTEYVIRYREQLWAEARELFRHGGVRWQDAERLALPAQKQAAVQDIWIHPVNQWLEAQHWGDGWTTNQLLLGACGVGTSYATRAHQERMRRVMTFLGWEQDQSGRWHSGLA
jgi:predicted P-loop ATPase